MANEVDALINVKDASGVLNEIYPITKKENVQGLAEFISNSLLGYAKKTDLDGYATETEINTKLEDYLPKSGGTMIGALTLKGAPTADLQAATKKYVDDKAPLIINASNITSMETTNAVLNSIGTASKMKREVLLISGTNVYHLNYATDDEVAFICIDSKKIYTATLCSGDETVSYDTCYVSATQRTVTLASANWDSVTKAQTVNANVVTTTNIVTVSPATKESADVWAESGVFCTEQGDGTLKFTCTDVPTSDITVSVVITG